jgi:hypothetical protein
LGGRIANPQGAAALQAGGSRAAQYMFGANQLNPTARFLQTLGDNEDFTSAVKGLFSGGGSPSSGGSYPSYNEFVPSNFPTNYFGANRQDMSSFGL